VSEMWPEPLPVVVPSPQRWHENRRIRLAVILLAAAVCLALLGVAAGYWEYNSPLSTLLRQSEAAADQQLQADLAAQGFSGFEEPSDSGVLGAIMQQPFTWLALVCLVGAWIAAATRSDGFRSAPIGSYDAPRGFAAPPSDAGDFFDDPGAEQPRQPDAFGVRSLG